MRFQPWRVVWLRIHHQQKMALGLQFSAKEVLCIYVFSANKKGTFICVFSSSKGTHISVRERGHFCMFSARKEGFLIFLFMRGTHIYLLHFLQQVAGVVLVAFLSLLKELFCSCVFTLYVPSAGLFEGVLYFLKGVSHFLLVDHVCFQPCLMMLEFPVSMMMNGIYKNF